MPARSDNSKQRAERRHWAAKTAAERAYVSYDRLCALERGSQQATICGFLSLGEALGLDPRELFNRVLAKVHYPCGYRPVKTA